MIVDEQAEEANEQMDASPAQASTNQVQKLSHRLFLDDVEYACFVRRLAWSPDGNILLTPSACYYDLSDQNASKSNYIFTVYGFIKHSLSQPSLMLPGLRSYATCVKFNPYLYELSTTRPQGTVPLLDLPYRMVFAVATTDQVIVYATDVNVPLAVMGNIHYATINDLAWVKSDLLVACSSDGYCSFMSTSERLVGKRLSNEKIEDEELRAHYEELDKVDIDKLERQVSS